MIRRKRMLRIVQGAALLVMLPAIALAQPAPSRPGASFHLIEATIGGIHRAMRSGQLICTQLVQAYLNRIAAYDQAGPKLNSVQNVNPNALALAAKLDAVYRTSGPAGPLHCIPVLVKDEIETSFMPTTYDRRSSSTSRHRKTRRSSIACRRPAQSSWPRPIWESSRSVTQARRSASATTPTILRAIPAAPHVVRVSVLQPISARPASARTPAARCEVPPPMKAWSLCVLRSPW